jgi:hypothetical protein
MAISLTHTTVAVGADAGNGEIGKTQWNEDHTLLMGTGKLLGRSTAGDGAVEEITLGAGLALAGGELTASGAVGGSDTQVQFNDGGVFGGDAGLTFNKTSKALTLGGGTVTTSSPVIDAAQTWNNGAVTFTGLKFNATDTASAAGSLLMDLQVGGTSAFNLSKAGNLKLGINASGTNAAGNNVVIGSSQGTGSASGGSIVFQLSPSGVPGTSQNALVNKLILNQFGAQLINTSAGFGNFGVLATSSDTQNCVGFGLTASSGASTAAFTLGPGGSTAPDTLITRRAAANLRLGAADAAAPVAQTLSVQSVVAGTTNTAGANLTITGSQGTGTGAGGSIVFQVAPAGSTGTAQNALSTALTIGSDKSATFAGQIFPLLGSSGGINFQNSVSLYSNGANNVTLVMGGGTFTFTREISITGAFCVNAALAVRDTGSYSWSSTSAGNGTPDLLLFRDAANTLALRNGANAQAFRVYNTTDGTNSEFGFIRYSSNVLQIGSDKTGTGTARSVALLEGANTWSFSGGNLSTPGSVEVPGTSQFRWTSRSRISSPSDGVVRLTAATAANGSCVELIEQTAPSAPAENEVRIYAVDNGSGKTQLMALFATGAAQQIAIEP